jgi:hypothetical protein
MRILFRRQYGPGQLQFPRPLCDEICKPAGAPEVYEPPSALRNYGRVAGPRQARPGVMRDSSDTGLFHAL